jgi:hypothetical protein
MIGRYIASGWDLKPIPAKEKGPRDPGWPNLQFSPDELERHVAKGGNVGVRLGASSGGLVDADLDCPEALALQDFYLPSTGAVFGRASKPRSHRLYIAAGAIFAAYTDPLTSETLVELRADGRTGGAHQTLIAFDDLSARAAKYDPHETRARWQHYHRSPPSRIGVGTLIHLARQNGWPRGAAA